MKPIDIGRKYKKLTHHEHILLRPERHLGSIRSAKINTWVYNPAKEQVVFMDDFEYSPALVKQFDEIITNCVDHSKTPEGKGLTQITVTISPMNGQIIVADNGGIPVQRHPNGDWLPEMLFGSLYAGSNFNEEDDEYNNKTAGGQNGEGASLVNVFSKWFRVSTNDGKKTYMQTWTDNMSKRDEPTISSLSSPGTSIAWVPDYARLGLKGLDPRNAAMLFRRAFEVAACNPALVVVLNGKRIRIERFGHFVDYFSKGATVDEEKDWMVSCVPSRGSFVHYSYVNSIATLVGGPHVDYVADQIVNAIRGPLEKKLKLKDNDLKPAMIKNHMCLFISATINNPRFDSQTKERMTTPVSQFGTSYKPSQRLINKVKDMVYAGLEAEIKAFRNDQDDAETQKAVKDIQRRDFREVEKYHGATSKERSQCVLMLTEGDSASTPILAARGNGGSKRIGLMPLRGKFLNVINATKKKMLENEELKNLCTVMGGIVPGTEIDLNTVRYPITVISTDADDDGKHIRGLAITLFCTQWPEYVRAGRLRILRTPFMRVWVGKQMYEFMNQEEYDAFLVKHKGKDFKKKYLKGLGGNSTEDFRRYLDDLDRYTTQVVLDDDYMKALTIGFNDKESDQRKEWFSDVCQFQTEDE
ncbi:topoisomerase II large subunit [Erwinia phage phiEa2809]|uniref:DNA topoisomerase 2 n=1 Tax=Erwinia phage phiEa2809 TaxID=1564096 RepID=A0A0A0YVA9_9CAUD|nr:DNA topoisomerase II [Erwinia phage phiEa2809]AIX13016.1 topoisomerase II large subunit [Erwinia phage phiEa2809]